MNPRERTLAAVLIGLIVLAVGGAAAYLLVVVPHGEKTRAAAKLDADLEKVRAEKKAVLKDLGRLPDVRRRSLPADLALAKREYAEMLSRVLQAANVAPGFRVAEKTPDGAGIPTFPGGKKAVYQKVAFEVTFDRADMWAVKDVLEGYYKLNVLQQITHFEVKVDATPGQGGGRTKAVADRRDLAVKFSTEAVVLDGAEPRRTLLPVPAAFAGIGGWLGYNGIALNPEAGRGLTPLQLAPVLSAKNRDYSLLVQRDPFHGPLPPPPPLSLGRISDVAVKVGDRIDPVRVPVSGDVAYTGKVTLTATVDGGPFKGTEVKIDDARKTLRLEPKAGETGTGTVTVVAKAANGEKAERSFKVRVDEPPPAVAEKVPAKEDIAAEIALIGVSVRSDGTATALVRDKYNPLTYELDVTGQRTKVTQYEHFGQRKKRNAAYIPARNEFEIDDDGNTATKRHFRIVAIDDGGLVVEDLKPAAAAPKGADPKGGKGGPPAMGAAPAAPLGALLGPAAVVQAAPQTLFYWPRGRSLAELTPVPPDEARRILQRSAASGPVGAGRPAVPLSDEPVPVRAGQPPAVDGTGPEG
jgi:hypothetical protein